jgi:type II secretory pathway pseudopilin PulG
MRRAFTMIDLLVTMAVMSIVILAAIPAFTADNGTRLVAAANLIIADLNNARAMSIQNPSDPMSVVIGASGLSYFLAKDSDPDSPIELPIGVGGKYAVTFGEGDHTNLWGVLVAPEGVDPASITVDGLPRVTFDTFGRLSPQADVRIEVASDSSSLTIVVRADTGDAFIE